MASAIPSDLLARLNEKLTAAVAAGQITQPASDNIQIWLVEDRYADYRDALVAHIEEEKWQILDDVFWTIIPFGTGGRRGRMYPIGCNAINDRTIGESAQGLANYLNRTLGDAPKSCALAYDTRINSRHFAELCAGIMVANGFKVFFLDDYRSTPELSFLVRSKKCDAGIMVTASHNPPSDNAVKVYGETGGQLVPPHDKAVIEEVQTVDEIKIRPFAQALEAGEVEICTAETDAALLNVHRLQSLSAFRNLKIIYSPLHGVGEKNVCDLLQAVGFNHVEVFGPHRERDGNFPNVPEHVSNPENPAVFDDMIARAKETGAELVLATDPDCDRMGAGAPLTSDLQSEWRTLTGNQLGALMANYVLSQRKLQGTISPNHYVVKTLVTTELTARIAESYGVRCVGNLHVGFKWIGQAMDQEGPDKFVLGTEESHGYLVGEYARDKDGAVACMLMCEAAAAAKHKGMTLHQVLDDLYLKHGYHAEQLLNVKMTGSDGMRRMQSLMEQLRSNPPKSVAGIDVAGLRDYKGLKTVKPDGSSEPLDAPAANMVILDLVEPGNYVAVRPSGTEPKVKLYMFTRSEVSNPDELASAKTAMAERLAGLAKDLQALAESVK